MSSLLPKLRLVIRLIFVVVIEKEIILLCFRLLLLHVLLINVKENKSKTTITTNGQTNKIKRN